MKTNRRDFIVKMGLATACTCAGVGSLNGCNMAKGISTVPSIPDGCYKLSENSVILDLGTIEILKEAGSAAKLACTRNEEELKLIIVHSEKNEYKVFLDHCTHGGRELNYKNEEGIMECSSFGHSKFNLDGKRLSGPAQDPLKKFSVSKVNDELKILLV